MIRLMIVACICYSIAMYAIRNKDIIIDEFVSVFSPETWQELTIKVKEYSDKYQSSTTPKYYK